MQILCLPVPHKNHYSRGGYVSGIVQVLECITDELELVNREISGQMDLLCREYQFHNLNGQYIEKILFHQFAHQGKLLRPALMILAAYAAGKTGKDSRDALVKLAAGVEMIHSASLVHDDIIDNSEYRREQLTLSRQYGNSTAVLVGDILYAQFFSIVTGLDHPGPEKRQKILRLFCKTTKQMCFGEIWENRLLETGAQPSFDDYLRILEHKTAILMASSCECGAVFGDAEPAVVKILERFGHYFGIAYQLTDDYIDRDSLLKDNPVILDKANFYLEKAEKLLCTCFQTSRNQWINSLLGLCSFIREYAQTSPPN